ncbi:hypothetical protein HCN44_003412 [Aphidius gifuensis]|uniref:Prolow-density lipoprotein receptor-related protein 1-like beta-propeller domain-containing protein n=1 Tax=Aphidius gifuensis TaxID=684658 RepID=A0A835CSH8_APHGI|nr:hypothetical protein HCN44_003412 [Aphidius gifuensis]
MENFNPKIERSNLDGSNRKILILKDIEWSNGVALSIEKKKLYFSDASFDKIEVCNMNGSDRKQILNDISPHIFGLSILGDYLYWTDWQLRSIERVHKLTGLNRTTIVNQASLAIDWISHNIYWADLETKRIEVMKIDTADRKKMIWENLINPRFLIIDPIHGFIHWSELSDTDKGFIARSKLDGTS